MQTDVGEFSVSFKRQTQVYWTVQGSQTPFVIARGPLTMDGTIQYDPTNNEFPLDYMLLNAQAPMTIICANSWYPELRFRVHFDVHRVSGREREVEDHEEQGSDWLR